MEFEEIKEKIDSDMKQRKEIESTDTKSGIYSIYIDDFNSELMKYEKHIIPIYIGQSKDIFNRKKEHEKRIKNIFSYPIDVFNSNLKTKKEGQYLYHKIRKCINEANLSVENIKFKVIEYCDENKLLEREKQYIETYGSEKFGLNQISSIQKIIMSDIENDSEEDLMRILDDAELDINEVILNKKSNYGFAGFNASMLCYNLHVFLGKIEKKEHNPKNLNKYSEKFIIRYNDFLEPYGDIVEETFMFFEPGIPDFIEMYLKLNK